MLMKEIGLRVAGKMKLLVDNKSAIDLTKHPVAHERSKHIETRFHFLRGQVTKGNLELVHCSSEKQLADLFTKPLRAERFHMLCKEMKITSAAEILNYEGMLE